MSELADAVLPLIRTRADLYRRSAANAHGKQMNDAVDLLESAADADPRTTFAVTQRAIGSALKVIMRADDSSGIIGDACRRLLGLHARLAEAARPAPAKLVNWMIDCQFASTCDFFEIDPVAYASALGTTGVAAYRARLDEIAAGLGPEPDRGQRWSTPHSHERFVLEWNAQRLAVLDRDVDAVIRTHARDRKVAAWVEDTARALAEIGEVDLAIDWARQASEFDAGHQALTASDYWCELLAEHRPDEIVPARLTVFRRWPNATTAARLRAAVGTGWPQYEDEVLEQLSADPRQAVLFVLHTLKDVRRAWKLALSLGPDDDQLWSDLAAAYEKVDPVAVLPVHLRLIAVDLEHADAQRYRSAARRLTRLRALLAGTPRASEVDDLVAELREEHRRRPRLQQEFTRAGLP